MLLNIDLGELPDEADVLYALTDIANIACGGHTGTPASMTQAILRCKAHAVAISAHPSYVDWENFGRNPCQISPEQLHTQIFEQCAQLRALAEAQGMQVHYAKAHGALYHACSQDAATAAAVASAIFEALGPVGVLGSPSGHLRTLCPHWLNEGFADRGYAAGEQLLPRRHPNGVLGPKAAALQAQSLLAAGRYQTLCVHGDGPEAVTVAQAVRQVLDGA